MNLKKSILLTILLFVLSNILTTIWYASTDAANYVSFRREEINYGGLMLNHLIFAVGFMYLFPFYARVHNSKSSAFLFGVILSSIMFIPTGLVVRSIWTVEFNTIFLMNTIAHLIIGGVLGLVSNIMYNYKRESYDSNE